MDRLLMGFAWFFALMGVYAPRKSFGEELSGPGSVTQYGKAQIESD
jgi:hypothetical protein